MSENTHTTFLHLTSNLGSLFEEQVIEEKWFEDLNELISKHCPQVVAIHCQEIGGKDFEVTMPKVDSFIERLKGLECFSEYDKIRGYVDSGYTDMNSFTALGCFYLIHKSVESVLLWNFNSNGFEPVVGEKIFTQTLQSQHPKLSYDHTHFKDRFPNNYFPTVRWTRKGFLHTKWRINSLIVNLVNIHLFHDEDNLVALEQSPSVYSQYRQKALHHTLQHISKTSSGVALENTYMFGDFNFRLDLSSVIKHLTSPDYHTQFIRGEDGNLLKVLYRNTLSGGDDDNLCIERRKFYLNSHAKLFKAKFLELLQFDNEMKKFEELRELPITFPPSYPFSEDVSKGEEYMEKRCPAWCDRILVNKSAMDALQKSPTTPVYDMLSRNVCVGDHKPIYMFFSTRTALNESNQDH